MNTTANAQLVARIAAAREQLQFYINSNYPSGLILRQQDRVEFLKNKLANR